MFVHFFLLLLLFSFLIGQLFYPFFHLVKSICGILEQRRRLLLRVLLLLLFLFFLIFIIKIIKLNKLKLYLKKKKTKMTI